MRKNISRLVECGMSREQRQQTNKQKNREEHSVKLEYKLPCRLISMFAKSFAVITMMNRLGDRRETKGPPIRRRSSHYLKSVSKETPPPHHHHHRAHGPCFLPLLCLSSWLSAVSQANKSEETAIFVPVASAEPPRAPHLFPDTCQL